MATTGLAVALSLTFVTQSVLAVSNEQLLFLEVRDAPHSMFLMAVDLLRRALHLMRQNLDLTQLLMLQAWRAVDRAYYDKNFNGKSWFRVSIPQSNDVSIHSMISIYRQVFLQSRCTAVHAHCKPNSRSDLRQD